MLIQMKHLFDPPALPPHWPHAPRPAVEPAAPMGMQWPFLEGSWTVLAEPGFHLEGTPQGLAGAFGRGGVFRVGDAVVRPYRRGGLLGRVVQRRYLASGRFEDEYRVHRALWEAGFPTVRPLGCAWRRRLCGVEGLYFTEAASGRSWPTDWAGGTATLHKIWSGIVDLCAWGLWAPDLNATNVLVDAQGGIAFLDWDRAGWDCSADLRDRYRGRLARSLRKLHAPTELLTCLELL